MPAPRSPNSPETLLCFPSARLSLSPLASSPHNLYSIAAMPAPGTCLCVAYFHRCHKSQQQEIINYPQVCDTLVPWATIFPPCSPHHAVARETFTILQLRWSPVNPLGPKLIIAKNRLWKPGRLGAVTEKGKHWASQRTQGS